MRYCFRLTGSTIHTLMICRLPQGSKSASSMCGSRCQIFSVSGTPLHTDPPTPTPQGDTYTSLLYCLATEQRKAGGYFQQHLERLEDEVCRKTR